MKTETLKEVRRWLADFEKKNKDGDYVYSDGEMVDAAEELFKSILKEERDKVVVSYLTRQDLEDAGYDNENISDDDMERIASRMDKYYSEGYCDSFMNDLRTAAEDCGILSIEEEQDRETNRRIEEQNK